MQQAFPYQQQGWLNSQIGSLGSMMGGTSSTTQPAPNQTAQWLGLGLGAMGMFMEDGGRVKGYDAGGPVGSFPYSDVKGYIPQSPLAMGHGAPPPPGATNQQQGKQPTANDLMTSGFDLAKKIKGDMNQSGQPLSLSPAGIPNYSPSPVGSMVPIDTQAPQAGFGDGAMWSAGGAVGEPSRDPSGIYVPQHFADGGLSFDDRWSPVTQAWPQAMQPPADYMLNENETNNLGLGKEVSWSPDQNAAVAAYSPEGNGVVAQNRHFLLVTTFLFHHTTMRLRFRRAARQRLDKFRRR